MINVQNLTMKYDRTTALEDITFKIKDGDFIGIMGPNGAGKSTLFKAILGMVEPQSGKIDIDNGVTVSYVPQSAAFDKEFPIKVKDVVLMGTLESRIKAFMHYTKDAKRGSDDVMKKLGIYDLKERQIGELSGGQLQKVLIARALVKKPSIILLDEPTANLDEGAKREIFELLKELNESITIMVVSHNIALASQYINKSLIINRNVKYFGEPDDEYLKIFS